MPTIKELIEKYGPFFEKYKTWIIWGGTVLLVSIFMIFAILWGRQKEKDEQLTLIETPLQYDVSHTLVVGKDKIEQSDFPESLEVYKLISRNYNQDIDTVLSLLGQTGYSKKATQTVLYTWSRKGSYVEYVPDSQNLFFRFEDDAQTGIETRTDSIESAGEFLKQFYKKFFDRDYDFTNVKMTSSGNRVRIQGNREVNGLPMYVRSNNDYTDYIVVDSNGGISEGNLSLVEYATDNAEKIQLVDVSNLQSAMSRQDYPKEVFQLYGPSEDPGVKEDEDGHGLDAFEEEPPIATNSVAQSIELVYYFSDTSLSQLAPAYRVKSKGLIRHEDENVEVNLLIYANALDPNRVYVPGESE